MGSLRLLKITLWVIVIVLSPVSIVAKDDLRSWQVAKLLNIQTVDQVRTDYISLGGFTEIPDNVKLRFYFLTIRAGSTPYRLRFYREVNSKFSLPWKIGDEIWVLIRKNKIKLKTPNGKIIKAKILPYQASRVSDR